MKAKVEQLATTLGAKVIVDRIGGSVEVQVEAPHGKVWACTGDIHAIVAPQFMGLPSMPEIWASLLEDMQYGLADCETHDCDWCEEGTRDAGTRPPASTLTS
jgi:hypothetical protein